MPHEMRRSLREPDIMGYFATISACESHGARRRPPACRTRVHGGDLGVAHERLPVTHCSRVGSLGANMDQFDPM